MMICVKASMRICTVRDQKEDIRESLPPVLPRQILGKVQFCIPKPGWVSIGIKNLFSWALCHRKVTAWLDHHPW